MAEEVKQLKEKNKVDIFKHLFDKHGVEKVLADVIVAVDKQSGGFYKFQDGKQDILMVEPPRADIDEKYKYSDGVGFTGVVKEIGYDGQILDVKYPITFTTTQFWELVGQVKANFPEWSPLIDQSFEIIRNLKFEANTASYEVNGEERSKTRFALMRDENFTSKTLWVKEKANEARSKDGQGQTVTGGQVGTENKNTW